MNTTFTTQLKKQAPVNGAIAILMHWPCLIGVVGTKT